MLIKGLLMSPTLPATMVRRGQSLTVLSVLLVIQRDRHGIAITETEKLYGAREEPAREAAMT